MGQRWLYTHVQPDLDAAASVWAMRTFVDRSFDVRFVPASWDGAELREEDVAVDLDCGIKGTRPNGSPGSAFRALMEEYATKEDRSALWWLIEYVELQDTHGAVVRRLTPEGTDGRTIGILTGACLNNVLLAQKRQFDTDIEWIDYAHPIFDSLLDEGRSRARAQLEADRAVWYGEHVALLLESDEPTTAGVLFGRGAHIVVCSDGPNLRAVRRHDQHFRLDQDAITAILPEEERDTWFLHPAGFLVAHGTKKSPANIPSKLSPTLLAQAMQRLLS